MRVPAPDSSRPASADLSSLRSSIADITKFVPPPSLTSRAAESTDDTFFVARSRAWKVAPAIFGRDDPHGWGRRPALRPSCWCERCVPARLLRSGFPRFYGRHAAHFCYWMCTCRTSSTRPPNWSTLPSLREAAAAWSRIMSLKDALTGVRVIMRLRINEFYKKIFAALCTGDVSNVESLSDDDFPNIDNLVRASSLQLQRALAFVVQE